MPVLRPTPNSAPPPRRVREHLRGTDLPALEQRLNSIYGAVLVAYPDEIARRRLEQNEVKVFEVGGAGAPLMPGGSLLIATGHPEDEVFRALAEAAGSGDAQAVSDLVSKATDMRLHAGKGRQDLLGDPIERLAGVDVFGRVSYAGRVIADLQVVTDGLPLSVAHVPFVGGELSAEQFSADHYHRSGDTSAESIVIFRQPELTDLEKRVLREFPAERSGELVGVANPAANWFVAAAIVVGVGAGLAAAYYFARRAQDAVREHAQQEHQAQEQNVQENQVQQAQHDQGQQAQQDQGQDQAHQDDGGSLRQWLDRQELMAEIEGLDARAAVTALIQVRTQLLEASHIS